MAKYQVISPDGFTIEADKPYYTSKKRAVEAFKKWVGRYERQGYYSSNAGRINLKDLEYFCTFKTI
jgi:hypothetical protein